DRLAHWFTYRFNLLARDRRARRRVERPFSSARGERERRGQRADQGEAGKWTAVLDQGEGPLHGGTVAKKANKTKSGFFLFKLPQPFLRLRADIFWRGAPEADPALYGPINRKNRENIFANSRLDLPHRRQRQPVQRYIRLGSLGHDPAGQMMGLP